MTNTKLLNIAQDLAKLEQECQQGNNISENLSKMDEIIASLSIHELIELDAYMEENFEKFIKKT